jgi:hypothetical protein
MIIVGWEASRIACSTERIDLIRLEGVADVNEVIPRGRCFLSLDPDSTGIKNSVLHLLAAGVPGIVTKEVAAPFQAKGVGDALLSVSEDPDAAATACQMFLSSDSYWRQAQRDAIRLASGFTWESYEDRLVGVFRQSQGRRRDRE